MLKFLSILWMVVLFWKDDLEFNIMGFKRFRVIIWEICNYNCILGG